MTDTQGKAVQFISEVLDEALSSAIGEYEALRIKSAQFMLYKLADVISIYTDTVESTLTDLNEFSATKA